MLEQAQFDTLVRLAQHVERADSCRDVMSQVEFGLSWVYLQKISSAITEIAVTAMIWIVFYRMLHYEAQLHIFQVSRNIVP